MSVRDGRLRDSINRQIDSMIPLELGYAKRLSKMRRGREADGRIEKECKELS